MPEVHSTDGFGPSIHSEGPGRDLPRITIHIAEVNTLGRRPDQQSMSITLLYASFCRHLGPDERVGYETTMDDAPAISGTQPHGLRYSGTKPFRTRDD